MFDELIKVWRARRDKIQEVASYRLYCHHCEVSWITVSKDCWNCGKRGSEEPYKHIVRRKLP